MSNVMTSETPPDGGPIDDPDAMDVIYRRRAVRAFAPEPVPDSRIRSLIDAAVHAPTAMHQEPWQFVVVQDRDVLRRLSDRAKDMVKSQTAHHGRLLKRPGDPGDGIPSPMIDPAFNIFYNAGTLIIVCAAPVNEFVAADCWLAAENLMLAACAAGLGTCCIGFAVHVLECPDVKAELGIPEASTAFAPIIVGIPKGETPPTPRKSAAIVSWIRGSQGA